MGEERKVTSAGPQNCRKADAFPEVRPFDTGNKPNQLQRKKVHVVKTKKKAIYRDMVRRILRKSGHRIEPGNRTATFNSTFSQFWIGGHS